ncbi:MAG: hypothetical protein QOH16_3863 [Gaiellaceae bacterium]|nr:hypothetical protein [Gaiellaceae bacterium]
MASKLSQEAPDAPGTVEAPVLATLYDEVAQALDRQHSQIDSLNERAQQLFGFAAVILTIIAAVTPQDAKTLTKLAFVVAIPLFGRAAWYAAVAWRLASWRGDPDVDALWNRRRADPEEHFRYQVILNRLDSITTNDDRIAAKIETVKRAHFWLYCGFVYIAVLVAFRLLQ